MDEFHQSTISRTYGKCQVLSAEFGAHVDKEFVGFCKEWCIILYS